jgi:AraC-like DNA-binding protein
MRIHHIHQPFDVLLVTVDECPIKEHKNTFIELVYMFDGAGIYHINQNEFRYQKENLFLAMPMDLHYTEVRETTAFMFIRFNNIYLNAQKTRDEHSSLGDWIHKLEYIFHNNNHLQGCILRNPHDKPLVRALMEAIRQEYANLSEYFKKHTHETLQHYIINYKIALVEIRLKHSDMRINEIAAELGFTDDSHLIKTFRKHRGMSPLEYRREAFAVMER